MHCGSKNAHNANRRSAKWRRASHIYSQALLLAMQGSRVPVIIGVFQWAGEHRDYDFTSGEFRSSNVTIGEHRFEVVKTIT